MIDEHTLIIYTDGSSLQSPRRGGYGIRFLLIDSSGNEEILDIQSLGFKNATNNQMELMACINAIKYAVKEKIINNYREVLIYTDSRYVVDNFRNAIFRWQKSRWLLQSGRPVLNADLWEEFTKLVTKANRRIEIKWVKGHHKNHHNKAVDKMAKKSAELKQDTNRFIVHVRPKHSGESVEVGGVEVFGQKMSVRIITTQYLPVQKHWMYKYEVVSKKSRFFGKIDIIFSDLDLSLKAGHSYFLRVNSQASNPRIEKIYKEVAPKPKAILK